MLKGLNRAKGSAGGPRRGGEGLKRARGAEGGLKDLGKQGAGEM